MSRKILIIGAGPAGIAAATRLYENDIRDFVILEAENRIGGRINTIPFGNNVVDLGAEWCHGEKDNVVFQMANPLDALDHSAYRYKHNYYKSNGDVIDETIADKITALIMDVQGNYVEEMKLSDKSLGQFFIDKLEHIVANNVEYRDISQLVPEVLTIFRKVQSSFEGSDNWFDFSARGSTEYKECEGDNLLMWKGRGYKTILDIMMKRFPDPTAEIPIMEKILFNKTVNQINWTETNPNGSVEVVCEDGTSYQADHVLCTVSLGVLKERHAQLFNPELPAIKQNAIQSLGFGTVDKIFLEFAEPFWTPGWMGCNLLWLQEDLNAALAEPNSWKTELFVFSPVDHQPNILSGWITGPKAREMEQCSEDEIKTVAMSLLRKFVKNLTVPEPVRIKSTNWYSNRNFRGAYGGRTLAADALNAYASHLALPLSNSAGTPVVMFGGEATHDHYFSTVHGAIESGWREADRIIQLFKPESHLLEN